jgi:hypothetical protein
LFKKFFLPWYDEQSAQRRGYRATRPDAEGWARPSTAATEACPLTGDSKEKVLEQVQKMLNAAIGDWPKYLSVSGQPGIEWIDAFDLHFTVDRVKSLIQRSDATNFSNELLVTVCEFGAVLGDTLIQCVDSLEWIADWPYWESAVYDPASGYRINVFHWAIKKFSAYGVDDGYRAKLLACADLVRNGWTDTQA